MPPIADVQSVRLAARQWQAGHALPCSRVGNSSLDAGRHTAKIYPTGERLEIMDGMTWALLHYFLPVGLGMLAYWAIPWIRSFSEIKALPLRDRRIKLLIDEYRWVKGFSGDKRYSVIRLTGLMIVYGLYPLGVVIVAIIILRWYYPESIAEVNIAFVLVWIAGLSLALYSIFLFADYVRGITNGYLFDRYKQQTIKKLIKLGGNPEDLDEEETTPPDRTKRKNP
jgi:hypothetical protein